MIGTESNPYQENVPEAPTMMRAWRQLIIGVTDGSSSMQEQATPTEGMVEGLAPSMTKGQAVDQAMRGLLNLMEESRAIENFEFATVCFNHQVTHQSPVVPLKDVDATQSFDPTQYGIGGTAIATGLDAAYKIASDAIAATKNEEVPFSVVVLLLGDGEEQVSVAEATEAAMRLRSLETVTVASALFATKGQPAHGEGFLQSVVSAPNFYSRVYSAEQLRDFFHKSVTTATNAMGQKLLPPGSSS